MNYLIDLSSTELQSDDRERVVLRHTDVKRRFLGLIRIGNQAGDEIDQEGSDTAVTGVVDLGDVFELIVDRFNQGAFAQ